LTDGFAAARLGDLPDTALLSCTITLDENTRAAGLLLRADLTLDHYYQLRWEPGRNRLVFDRWPRPGDEPFMLERPLSYSEKLRLRVFIDGSVIVAYANDEIALSCRMYDHPQGQWGVFVGEGQATFSDVSLNVMA
jgi:beta-fructofuranosidase